MSRQHFSLIELLIAISIIAILASLVFFSLPTTVPGVAETKTSIHNIEMAMENYKRTHGQYPLIDRSSHINLSDVSDPEIKSTIIALLKEHTFRVNAEGAPEDYWEHPIYLIYSSQYSASPYAQTIDGLGDEVYFNPKTFQLISGGPDGSASHPGVVDDNVGNFQKN
jgi:prepilin-type N-terminal cleavage/methylation domain-containing protein